MKKIFKFYIVAMIISFLGVINVAAATLTFDGDNSINANVTGNQDVILNVGSEEIVKVEFTVATTDSSLVNLSLIENPNLSGALPNITGHKAIVSVVGDTILSNGAIATLKVTNNGNLLTNGKTTLKITGIKFYYKSAPTQEVSAADYTKEITLGAASTTTTTTKAKSTDAKLSSLSANNGAVLTPSFNTNTKSYKIFLKDTIKNLTLSYACDSCKVRITCIECTNDANQSRLELEIGKNQVTINTTSEDDKNTDSYSLIIYRGETTDNSSFLKDLKVSGFTINEDFDKKTVDYTLSVPFDTTDLDIIATPEDPAAKVEIKGAEDLTVGDNVITVTITSSESNDKKIYNITVTRLEEGEEVITTTAPIVTEEPKPKSKLPLIIGIVVGCLVIIGISAFAIFGKKKPKKGKKGKGEIISDEVEPEKIPMESDEITVQENDLKDELNIIDEKGKQSVDEALVDLMITKEIIMKEE